MKTLKLTGILIALLFSIDVWGQNAVAELHFESAEKAYNTGDYEEALRKLDDTERITGAMSRTLYLRIVVQDKLFTGAKKYTTDEFVMISSLRDNVAAYLEEMAEMGLDDRYREVFRIGEGLSKYPKTLEEWLAVGAEQAYNVGKYREALAIIDDIEKRSGLTPVTRYHRIIIQNRLFNGGKNYAADDFVLLGNLRGNVTAYLGQMAANSQDQHYREVYRIGEELNKYPRTPEEWQAMREKGLQEKKEREEQARILAKEREEQGRIRELTDFLAGKLIVSQIRSNVIAQEASEGTNDEGLATVYIVRPGKFVGSFVKTSYFFNNHESLKLGNKQHAVRRFSPGLLRIVQSFADQLSNAIALDLQPGNVYYVKDVIKASGRSELELVDEKDALAEINQTKRQD